MNRINTHFTRLFALLLLGSTALLSGCADGPGNGTTIIDTSGGTSSGTSSGNSGGASGGATGGATGGASGGASGGATGGTAPCPPGMVCDGSTTPIPVACPTPGQTFTQIPVGNAYVTHVDASGLACINCSVVDAVDVIDVFTDNFAIMTIPVGAIGSNSLTVTDVKTTFPAGSEAGYIVSIPDAPVLTLTLLQGINVTTIDNGVDTRDSGGQNGLLALDLLGILGNNSLKFVTPGPSTVPYNAARLTFSGLVGALGQLRVYGAGVCQ